MRQINEFTSPYLRHEKGHSGAVNGSERSVVRSGQISTRVKTRFLRFVLNAESRAEYSAGEDAHRTNETSGCDSSLGCISIIEGKGKGKFFNLVSGVYRIGRAENQEIQLSFGDNSISRNSHATIFNYGIDGPFIIRDGLKPNPVTVNGRLLRGERNLGDGDLIRIGETTLLFAEKPKA